MFSCPGYSYTRGSSSTSSPKSQTYPHRRASQDASWLFVCFPTGPKLHYSISPLISPVSIPSHHITASLSSSIHSRSPPVHLLHYQHSCSLGRAIPIPHPPTRDLPLRHDLPSQTPTTIHSPYHLASLPGRTHRPALTSEASTPRKSRMSLRF